MIVKIFSMYSAGWLGCLFSAKTVVSLFPSIDIYLVTATATPEFYIFSLLFFFLVKIYYAVRIRFC